MYCGEMGAIRRRFNLLKHTNFQRIFIVQFLLKFDESPLGNIPPIPIQLSTQATIEVDKTPPWNIPSLPTHVSYSSLTQINEKPLRNILPPPKHISHSVSFKVGEKPVLKDPSSSKSCSLFKCLLEIDFDCSGLVARRKPQYSSKSSIIVT